MESKICSMCKLKKTYQQISHKLSRLSKFNTKRGLKIYYNIKDKISNQPKINHERKDNLLQNKLKDIYILKNQLGHLLI